MLFSGTGTRADPVFLMRRQGNQFYSRSLEQWVEIELSLMRPSLTGKDIEPYYYETDNYLLFPYKVAGLEVKIISPEEMAEKYPQVWAYFNHPVNRGILEEREKGYFRGRSDWYCYSYPRNMNILGLPKLVLPDVAGRAEFACDDEGRYIIDTAYGIGLKEGSQISPLALTAILNSYLMTFFLQQTGTDLRGGYFRMKTAYLNPFPIAHIPFTTPLESRTGYLEIAKSACEICLTGGEGTAIIELVREHLSHGRTDVVHDLLAYLAGGMIELNKQKQAEMKDFLVLLSREIGTGTDSLTNKTRVQNYLGDYQEDEPHLSFDELLDILKKNRKLLSADVSARGFQERLQREYEGSLDKLVPVKGRLAGTDSLIDGIVCRLYGLTDEEIATVGGR